MATQLEFSHRQSFASLDGSDAPASAWAPPHRHVAFAVHGAVPSPQLYLQRDRVVPEWTDEQEEDRREAQRPGPWKETLAVPVEKRIDHPHMIRSTPRGPVSGRAKTKVPAKKPPTKKSAKPTASKPAKAARRPGWDSDARATSNLFDTTLKKSVLFQPRPGDRVRELQREEQLTRDTPMMKTGTSVPVRGKVSPSTNKWNARMAASLPMQQPTRRAKDFVKMNMEKITGQRYETLVRRNQVAGVSRRQGSVFERLSAPVIHKSLLRFRSLSPTRTQLHVEDHGDGGKSPPFSPTKLVISSPVLSTSVPQEVISPPPRGRVGSNRPSTRSASPRERVSTPPSTRRSTLSRASSPGFRSDRGRDEINMTERVFEVLDRQGRGRIGVEQILDGLRLLQLPATHNQVADYVYLIHEGAINSVDYEEWAILVGTLDAASHSSRDPSRPSSVRSRQSPQTMRELSPPRSRSSMRSSPPPSVNQVQSPQRRALDDPHHGRRRWERTDRGVNLSTKMPQSNLTRIARHSDDLAELLLEDLLLDTVEELNKHERNQTTRKRQHLQVEALSSILRQIESIEVAEAELIDSGFALGYEIDQEVTGTGKVRDGPKLDETTTPLAPPTRHTEDKLSLPLGIIMSVDLDGKSTYEDPTDGLLEPPVCPTQPKKDVAELELEDASAVPDHEMRYTSASMACLGGRLFQNVEKNRVRFLKHRQLVESSLESTGMDQASVIEMLADLLLDEIALECAAELENGVEALADTLAQTLL